MLVLHPLRIRDYAESGFYHLTKTRKPHTYRLEMINSNVRIDVMPSLLSPEIETILDGLTAKE